MRTQENGNVLFLILIAVILFAALAYAITSSSRSGSGNASKDKTKIVLAEHDNYVASLRGAAMRMQLNGTPKAVIISTIRENPLAYGTSWSSVISDWNTNSSSSYNNYTATTKDFISHPDGGAVAFRNYYVGEVATLAGFAADNQVGVVRFIGDVGTDLCKMVNARQNIASIPTVSDGSTYDAAVLSGKPEACAANADDGGVLFIYSVIFSDMT